MEKDREKRRVTVGVTIEQEVLEEIKRRAKDSERSVSRYINWVLRKHLRGEEE